MSIASINQTVSVKDYLEGEARARRKHEYLNGVVYAMVGATNAHNTIASNVVGMLYQQLRGRPCRVFNSDTKVRIQRPGATRFYYPDASVVCHRNPSSDTFQDAPVVVVEVVSESTRRTDEQEKCESYLSIPSVRVYLLLEQSSHLAVVYRRGEAGFDRQVYSGLEAEIPLPEIECRLALREVYEAVELTPIVPADERT